MSLKSNLNQIIKDRNGGIYSINELEAKIELTRGNQSIIDSEDYTRISNFRWFLTTNGYAARMIKGLPFKKRKMVFLHREILGAVKGSTVDHINGDTLDNRKSNLRICKNSENSRNRIAPRINKSTKYKGVSWFRRDKKWRTQITKDYKHYHIGYFSTERSAAMAYDIWARDMFGEYARLNFIPCL